MIDWTLERIAEAAGGRLIGEPDLTPKGVGVDARTLEAGSLFVAVRGRRFDGHDFLGDAFERGARAAIVSDREAAAGRPAVVVEDTVEALGRLARAYRRSLGARIVGVTGSAGKTSTVRMLEATLGAGRRGTASVKSFNNSIGVPLTILSARADDEFLVCEMGTSGPGEIARLASIVEPDLAAITSIGRAHLERLGDLQGVRREKATIFSRMSEAGLGLIPSADAGVLEHLPAGVGYERVGVERDADRAVEAVKLDADGTRFRLEGGEFRTPLIGAHHAVNAAIAVRIARELGLDTATIARGLARTPAVEMRFETRRVGGAVIVNDAYNANPESMAAALRDFARLHAGAARRVGVLGDMLELGAHADEAHAEAVRLAAELGYEAIVTVGPLMAGAVDRELGGAALALESLEGGGADRIAGLIEPGDAVLLKGSRGIGLERVLERLLERPGRLEGAGA